jgi:hypothetical protein
MDLYMIMLVFVYAFIFWIYLPHMRENMWTLSFWAWLTSLNMMSSNCIHLDSNHMSLFLMAEQNFIVYMYHIYVTAFKLKVISYFVFTIQISK